MVFVGISKHTFLDPLFLGHRPMDTSLYFSAMLKKQFNFTAISIFYVQGI